MNPPLVLADGRFDRKLTHAIARTCRSYRYDVKAKACRSSGLLAQPGGWQWRLILQENWLASLIRACLNADPTGPAALLDELLEALTKASEGDDDLLDSLWRLGGPEALDRLVKGPPGTGYLGPSLGFTLSFDHDAEGRPHAP
jgi:hypothetical protein